jgi:hypothetical protein
LFLVKKILFFFLTETSTCGFHSRFDNGLPKMSKNMNKRATKCKSTTENSILKFLTVSSVSSDSIVKGIVDEAPDNFQVQRVITCYFWKWWVFAYFLCTVVLSTSEKIVYMYTFKIMFDTSVIQ